ncbi:MAG: polyamine aminopropyltransferase [Fastidiosipilaceae bacterium]|jgi:spermidine synthase|nr:polyamine aminopropyltransferase [Clostridiaceae bacterium]
MELWFTETHSPGVRFSMKVTREIVRHQSDYQSICILDTEEFGRVLIMDDYLMLTEKDEPFYHEMITHVGMAVNPAITDVLVIGAGDGGTIRELTRYPGIRHIDLVEIDEDVISLCKAYLPQTACKLDDPRVHLRVEDGVKFVRQCENRYQLIIVDSTDPFGPGEGLFTREFYGNCFNALTADGIMLNQHESTFYDEYSDEMTRVHRTISDLFPIAMVYQSHIPTYPSGHWLFGFASKGFHPIDDLKADTWNALKLKTHYYNTDLHRGAFALPNYVKEQLNI